MGASGAVQSAQRAYLSCSALVHEPEPLRRTALPPSLPRDTSGTAIQQSRDQCLTTHPLTAPPRCCPIERFKPTAQQQPMKVAGLLPFNNHQPVVPSHDGMHVVKTGPVRRKSLGMLRLHKLKALPIGTGETSLSCFILPSCSRRRDHVRTCKVGDPGRMYRIRPIDLPRSRTWLCHRRMSMTVVSTQFGL